MTQRPTHVPKFGNWDANDHVPFTAVFENARAGKGGGGKMINPNDPSENPAAFGLTSDELPPQSRDERRGSREEDGQNAGLPPRRMSGDAQGYRRPGSNGGQSRTNADGSRRGSAASGVRDNGAIGTGVGENQGADQSPSHQAAYQGRLGNRPASGSPAWERKVPPEGGTMFAPATPGKSRLRPGSVRGDETPDRSPALPKFGAWDEKDPSSGEGFTVIFNQARNEKKTGGPVRIPALQAESPAGMDHGDAYKRPQHMQQSFSSQKKASTWACCFSPSAEQ